MRQVYLQVDRALCAPVGHLNSVSNMYMVPTSDEGDDCLSVRALLIFAITLVVYPVPLAIRVPLTKSELSIHINFDN